MSATPGKTKHFQTLLLDDDLMLCDCPGLVLPSFVCTKADMIVHGILPIDQVIKNHCSIHNFFVYCIILYQFTDERIYGCSKYHHRKSRN